MADEKSPDVYKSNIATIHLTVSAFVLNATNKKEFTDLWSKYIDYTYEPKSIQISDIYFTGAPNKWTMAIVMTYESMHEQNRHANENKNRRSTGNANIESKIQLEMNNGMASFWIKHNLNVTSENEFSTTIKPDTDLNTSAVTLKDIMDFVNKFYAPRQVKPEDILRKTP